MKRLPVIVLLAASAVMFSAAASSARDRSASDAPKRIIIHTFTKGNIRLPEREKRAKAEESFDYLALILPSNMKMDIDKSGLYATEFSSEAPEAQPNMSFGEGTLSKLKEDARERNADFVIAGIFSVDGKNLTVDCSILVARTGAVIRVPARAELGVIIDAIVANLSDGVLSAISANILRPAPSPSITVSGGKVRFAGRIEITPAAADDEVWYTLDGTAPSKEEHNGDRYSGPFTMRESVKIRAVTYRSGFLESKQEEKEMAVRDPLPYFTIGFSSSTEVFFGAATRIHGRASTRGLTLYGLWEAANIESLRDSAASSLGLYFGATAYGGNSGFGETSRSALLGTLGAAWLIRAGDFFTFQIIPMGGYALTKTFTGNKDTGELSVLKSSKGTTEESYDPWGGAGLFSNINFASGIYVRLGAVYRHIFYTKWGQTDGVSIDAGLGYRF